MKKRKDPIELEKPRPTVADSFTEDESEPLLEVRAKDVWTDFVRVAPEKRDPDAAHRHDSSVPLLDDMTGIRQWE